MVVNTEALKENPAFGKALVGAWYETMALMKDSGAKGDRSADRHGQARPAPIWRASRPARHHHAVLHARGRGRLRDQPDLVEDDGPGAQVLVRPRPAGQGARTVDAVGIAFPGGKVLGDQGTSSCASMPTYMKMAAEGKL